jgi:hypothetical protein
MRAKNVPRGLGFDASVYVDPCTVGLFKCSGYKFRVGYVNRQVHVNDQPDPNWPVSISKQELREHLRADMPVSLVQFFNGNGNYLKPGYGTQVGTAAATNAQLLGAPKGITLWVDAEWSKNLPSEAQVWQYLNEWSAPVQAAGYEPGIYVGSGQPLGSDALYGLPRYTHYWRAASIVPNVRTRGYQMIQGMPQKVHGVEIDPDIAALDHLGDRFKIIWP